MTTVVLQRFLGVADGQIFEREQAHGAVQSAEPDRGANKDVVPEQADQVEEAAGVQAEDRPPARLLPTGTALRIAVRTALLLPGSGNGRRCRRRRRNRRRHRPEHRWLCTAAVVVVRSVRRARGTGCRYRYQIGTPPEIIPRDDDIHIFCTYFC